MTLVYALFIRLNYEMGFITIAVFENTDKMASYFEGKAVPAASNSNKLNENSIKKRGQTIFSVCPLLMISCLKNYHHLVFG